MIIPLYFAAAIGVFSLLQIAAASYVIDAQFSRFEVSELDGRREQYRVLLGREMLALAGLTQSYAEWIETYEYMTERDGSYIIENYGTAWLEQQHVDAVLIVDAEGGLVWSSVDVPELGASAGSRTLDRTDPRLFPADFGALPPSPVSGYAEYAGLAAMYASWPVTDDNGTKAPNGLLVFVRKLGPELLAAFSPGRDFSVDFVPLRGLGSAPPEGASLERAGGVPVFAAYDVVADPLGEPLGYWRYRKARTWTTVASSLMAWFSLLSLVAGAGAYTVASIVVRRRMVGPIKAIRDHLDRFSESFVSEARLQPLHRDELGELSRHVNALVERVEGQTRELDRLAGTDGLTGLPNRRRLDATLAALETKAAIGMQKPEERHSEKRGLVACGLMDVDFFKKYNDLYGHAEGDEALRRIAGAIREGARRPGDLPSRYGGEEFALVLPDTDEEGALVVLERIRALVEGLGLVHADSAASPVVTISVGVAAMPSRDGPGGLSDLLKLADKALYAAKATGRNRVVAYSSLG